MNILFLCGREASYPLNQVLIQSLRKLGNVTVPHEDKHDKGIVKRSLQVLLSAIPGLITNRYDLIFVSFYGHLLMPPVRLLTRKPVIFHPFISTYETLIFDRKKASPRSLVAKLSFWLDKTACRLADHLVMDTQANIRYFARTFGLPEERFSLVVIGSDEGMFAPRAAQPQPGGVKTVLYHGSYLPLQGIDVIIHAAKELQDQQKPGQPTIQFNLLGGGLEFKRIQNMVNELKLTNVRFLPAVPVTKLPDEIARADICLGGHFGTSDKAARVIAGKTFQDIAMGKATIVGDNEANRELLTHGVDAWLCPMDDPKALAHAVLTLAADDALREQMGCRAAQTFLQHASLPVVEEQVRAAVKKALTT